MLNLWLTEHVPQIVRLARLPFDRVTHERFFASIGWTVTRESWYPVTCFAIHFGDVGRRLVAVYEENECGMGIGLYAVTSSLEGDGFYIGTRADFDATFRSTCAVITPLVPETPVTGTYDSDFGGGTFHYVYWAFPHTFMTVVQHFEGDGHCGHEASLDIRVVPRNGDALAFPLTTNILF